MSYVVTGLAFIVLALVVLIWRTFQDARVIADRPHRALVPAENRAGGVMGGDFSGISGGVDGGLAGVAVGGDAGGACGGDGGGGAPC